MTLRLTLLFGRLLLAGFFDLPAYRPIDVTRKAPFSRVYLPVLRAAQSRVQSEKAARLAYF